MSNKQPSQEQKVDDDIRKQSELTELNKSVIFYQQIPESCTVLQVACTHYNGFILSTSGLVYSWGECTYALGRKPKTPIDAKKPSVIATIKDKNIISLACGDNHVLALDSESEIYAWGDNECGQLGIGNTNPSYTPNKLTIEYLPAVKAPVIRISAGPDFSFALAQTEGDEGISYDTFVWGNNKNVRLGQGSKYGERQEIFTEPTKIMSPAWESDEPDKIMISNKRGKNMVYKTKFSHEIAIGGVGKYELLKINIENDNLKRRLEIMTKKVSKIEDILFDERIKPSPSAWNEDDTLKSFQNILEETIQTDENCKVKIEEKTQMIGDIKIAIEAKEKKIISNEIEERKEKEEIEELEDLLAVHKLRMEKENGKQTEDHTATTAKANIAKKNDKIKSFAKMKLDCQSELIKLQTDLKELEEDKVKLIKQKLDAEAKIELFTTMVDIRKNQLVHEFFDKNQKAVETDLKNFISIYEAANDAAVENLSKSVLNSCLTNYIRSSNHIFKQLKQEISEIQKRRKLDQDTFRVFQPLSQLWSILEDNIDLRERVNHYTQGTLSFLTETDEFREKSEGAETDESTTSYIDEKELMKRILAKSNLDTVEDEGASYDTKDMKTKRETEEEEEEDEDKEIEEEVEGENEEEEGEEAKSEEGSENYENKTRGSVPIENGKKGDRNKWGCC